MAFTPADLTGNLFWGQSKNLTAGTITAWPNLGAAGVTATNTGTTVVTAATPLSGKAVRCVGASIAFNRLGGIYATSNYNGTYTASNLVDGDSATSWASTGYTSQAITQQLITASAVTAYTLAAEATAVTRAPSAWTFQGGDGASTWTTLDTRSGVTFTGTTAQQFTFTNSTAYPYYRLVPSATPAGSGEIWLSRFTVDGATLYGPAREIWRVIKSNDTSGTAWALGASGSSSHYTFSGTVYDDTFALTRQSFTPATPVTTWRVYRVVNEAGTWKADLDGVNQVTATGKQLTINPNPNLLGSWSGDIAEVLVRDRASTAQEAADLLAYFNSEHGTGAILTGTPTASSTAVGSAAANAFDGSATTQWLSNAEINGATLKLVPGTSSTVASYQIGGAISGDTTKSPKTWKLQGSNDGSSWTDLDTQTNAAAFSASELRTYALSQGYTFQQWRLIFTANQGHASQVGVSEFDLFPSLPAAASGGGTGSAFLQRGSTSRIRSRSRR